VASGSEGEGSSEDWGASLASGGDEGDASEVASGVAAGASLSVAGSSDAEGGGLDGSVSVAIAARGETTVLTKTTSVNSTRTILVVCWRAAIGVGTK
jgi:hypothetical protein